MDITQTQIEVHERATTQLAPSFAPALARSSARRMALLSVLVIGYARAFCRSVVRNASAKQKTLSVRGTAALGDRRFVSVVQFERQRFLVGCSASSVSLLAQLPDEPSSPGCDDHCRDDHNKDAPGKSGDQK